MKYPTKAKINISKNEPVTNKASADSMVSGRAWMKLNSPSSGAKDPETSIKPTVNIPQKIIAKVKLANER